MQHPFVDRPNENRPTTIEVAGEPLGVVIPDPQGFRFLAVRFQAFSLDGHTFESIEAAQAAVSEAVAAA